MRTLRLLAFLALAGCGAQMVKPAGSGDSPYAPVNEVERGGVVKYLSDGASFVVKKRRDDAYKQMYKSCGGPYRIIAEGQKVEGGVVIADASAATSATATATSTGVKAESQTRASGTTTAFDVHYWYIQYKCEEASPPSK